MAGRARDLKLGSDMKAVVARMLPIDEPQTAPLGLSLDRLLQAHPQRQQIVNLLSRAAEPIKRHAAQLINRLGNRLAGKR